ncbi:MULTISPECIES: hypothetical protein [unclassified Fusibacter]|uniref:hypothetical protein n=1 Tax=unclassified Fusibacter TaxID=2624464 RepID=UPI00101299E3|nr:MULTISPECIES: hypothetical protein [unclassified Fusibacter]MCK8059618.1 hypothetical protein [Fusibacter sp. A2]NPE21419.1 hypothetical protein [Fusibacter sp. A1]RXV61832.1 hypothetical protein DWB64_06235 [Fusibacter sp. A1]
MTTRRLMDIALALAGLEKEPHDTVISVAGEGIEKVLIGIDMDTPELLLAEKLGYDCVVSHHPKADSGSMDFHKVMNVQIDKMVEFGVPINKAQKKLRKKVADVDLGSHVGNYDRTSSAARLMNMPYMNIHLPADILTENFVQEYLDTKFEKQPKTTLQDICDALNEIEEYQKSLAKPVIRVGGAGDYAGKIAVLMAGGTNGGAEVFKSYFEAGVGTIICMHVPGDVKKAVEEQGIGNVIVAGHMSSDSIGLNMIIKEWEKAGVEVTKMSGIV